MRVAHTVGQQPRDPCGKGLPPAAETDPCSQVQAQEQCAVAPGRFILGLFCRVQQPQILGQVWDDHGSLDIDELIKDEPLCLSLQYGRRFRY